MLQGGDDLEDDFVIDELVALSEDEGAGEGEFFSDAAEQMSGAEEAEYDNEVPEVAKDDVAVAAASAKKRKRREKEKEKKAKVRVVAPSLFPRAHVLILST